MTPPALEGDACADVGRPLGLLVQFAAHLVRIGDVNAESLFLADLLRLGIGDDQAIVDAVGRLRMCSMSSPSSRLSVTSLAWRRSAMVRIAMPSRSLHSFRADAPDFADRQRGRTHRRLSGVMRVSPSGFSRSLASLARNLFGATPTDAVSGAVVDVVFEFPRCCGRGAEHSLDAGEVEERLVDAQRLNDGETGRRSRKSFETRDSAKIASAQRSHADTIAVRPPSAGRNDSRRAVPHTTQW